MKIIAIYHNNEQTIAKELTTDDFISFNEKNDNNVFHIIVIHARFKELGKHKLKYNCAIHLDWCLESVILTYGKELFIQ